MNKIVISVALLCSASLALADESWNGNVQLGYTSNSGNSDDSNLKAAFDAKRDSGDWKHHGHIDASNSESEGVRSSERYFGSYRLGYDFSENQYVYAYGSYEDDRFSGYDYQSTISIGYGHTLIDEERMKWNFEIGPGYRQNKLEEESGGGKEEDAILRAFTHYEWTFSETATFFQDFSVEHGQENTISKSVTALKTKVVGGFALQLSYTVKHTSEVPEGTEKTDTETAITLVYNF